MSDGAGLERTDRVVSGLPADPDLSADIAQQLAAELADVLSRRVSGRVSWQVRVICDPFTASVIRGRERLLAGMVRANRPWRLALGLSTALAAALAVSAFGLVTGTIWQLGDALGLRRVSVSAAGSMAAMVVWLIVEHDLWERPSERSTRDREQVVLYNAATCSP